nr:tripartite tricarboxylate transporter substrate binding protein [Variovorax boronicumulans]
MRTNVHLPARRHALAALAALCCTAALPAAAQPAYPERPVRIVSISSAGTGVDEFTRLAAKHFSDRTGKSFFVENRPGANGIIATDHVAKSTPDGYTLLLTAASAITANPYMYRNLPYDPNKDLAPVARMSVVPIVVTVPTRSPHQTLQSLLDAARAQPGKLSYGTSTAGYKVMVAAMNGLARVQAVEVPYKGTTTLLPDLMSGTLDYAMVEISQVVPQMQAGKLRPLAVSSPARVPVLAGVPTLAELGMGEATLTSWMGLFAPAATPPAIVRQLSALALEFVASPEAKAHFEQRGTAAYPAALDGFRQAIVEDQARWKHYIAAVGLQPE